MSEREARMNIYFMMKAPVRLCDSLGFDQLMLLRNVLSVNVEHVPARHAGRRTNEERSALERLLRQYVTRPETEEPKP